MKADLHVHTDISDSSFSLEETLRLAKEKRVTHLGIVNHDTVRGLRDAVEAGKKEGIKVIPGIEISAVDFNTGRKVHILGYNFNLEGKNITSLCSPILKRRHENSLWQIEQLISSGYEIDIDKICARASKSEVIYKQHIMAELIDKGYTDGIYSDLYKKLFKDNGICDRDIEYVDVYEAVKAIKADNGIAVLAHPGQLDSYYLIDSLIDAGLDGIELCHEDHTEEDVERIISYQEKHNLILTGGSDFHGKYGSSTDIGDILSPGDYLDFLVPATITDDAPDPGSLLPFIEEIVRQAGKLLRKAVTVELSLSLKNNEYRDIVTKYDFEVEDFIVQSILKQYPHHSFITEERTSGRQYFADYTWIIDPIDGTVNFVNLKRDFAISVALYKNKKPCLGVVYDVMKNEMYSAVAGHGAFINGISYTKTSSVKELKNSLIDISLNSINIFCQTKGIDIFRLISDIRGHRAYGAASLSICKVAKGELQSYISAKLQLWDYAAAIILLRECGGCYQYFDPVNSEDFPLDPVIFIASEAESILESIVCKLYSYRHKCNNFNQDFTEL